MYLHVARAIYYRMGALLNGLFWLFLYTVRSSSSHKAVSEHATTMFVDRLATDDMQSCNSIADIYTCTCTCTYAQLSVGWGRRGLATNLNVLWQVRGWGYCLLFPMSLKILICIDPKILRYFGTFFPQDLNCKILKYLRRSC